MDSSFKLNENNKNIVNCSCRINLMHIPIDYIQSNPLNRVSKLNSSHLNECASNLMGKLHKSIFVTLLYLFHGPYLYWGIGHHISSPHLKVISHLSPTLKLPLSSSSHSFEAPQVSVTHDQTLSENFFSSCPFG